jgi:hypothetical protein
MPKEKPTPGKIALGCLIMVVGAFVVLAAIGLMLPKKSASEADARGEPAAKPVVEPIAVPSPPVVPPPIGEPPTPLPGIGITQAAIREPMEKLGYVFSPGVNQVMGKLSDGTAYCQLLGDARDLTSAGMVLAMKTETDLEMLRNITAMTAFLEHAIPSWSEADSWALKALAGDEPHVTSPRGALVVVVDKQPSIGITTVTVRRKE